jgi:hypothetical protein
MAEILKIHAYGELHRPDLAKQSLDVLETSCPAIMIPLRDALTARYELKTHATQYEDSWILEEECRVALLNAA